MLRMREAVHEALELRFHDLLQRFHGFRATAHACGLAFARDLRRFSQWDFAANHVFDDFFGVLRNVQQLARLLLLIVEDDLRRRFARFKLSAHPLDLRCLLFYHRS